MPSIEFLSIVMPGLMVVEMVILWKYVPFAEAGFNLATVWIISVALSRILSAEKEALPTLTWMIPVLSILKSILPAFTSFTALPTSSVTVPDLGLGIRPRGPNTLPNLPTLAITVGVQIITSMSVHPPSIFVI